MPRLVAASPLTVQEAARLLAPLTAQGSAQCVILAVSGGPDSTALMGLYAEASAIICLPRATVATVDHDLRPGSADEAAAVGTLAQSLGLEHEVLRWSGVKPANGIQEAAREARYRLLSNHARRIGAVQIVTAHTLDDQAETVLMRMMRGSGLKGLAAMDTFSPNHGATVFRPFLSEPKDRLVATCNDRGWPFVVDPANKHFGFMRARLRRLAPELAREGLTADRLARLANRLRRADEALDAQALRAIETCRIWRHGATVYDAPLLAAEPEEIVVRVFAHVIAHGRDVRSAPLQPRLERIEALANDFRRAVHEGIAFRKNSGGLLFTLRNGELSLRAEPPRRTKKLTKSADNRADALGKPASAP